MPDRILVLGVGNPLMEDEGVGVVVVHALDAEWAFPPEVEVLDAGTMGMSILNLFMYVDRVLVLDAIDGGGHAPGTVVRLEPDDIGDSGVAHSLHDVRLSDVLQMAELIGCRPHAEFVGVQVASMRSMTEGLTEDVAAAVPTAVAAALDVLREWGVNAERRDAAG